MSATRKQQSPAERSDRVEQRDAGGTDRNSVVASFVPVVRSIAQRIASRLPPSVDVDDLISAGVIGLIDAVEKYDASKCTSFRKYAEIRVRGAILDELRSMDWMSRTMRQQSSAVGDVTRELEAKLGRKAEEDEIAAEMGVDVGGFRALLARLKPGLPISLEEVGPASDGEQRDFTQFLADNSTPDPYREAYFRRLRSAISDSIDELPDKQRVAVRLYFFDEMSLKDIGKVLEVTESRVCQLHTAATKALRVKLQKRLRDPLAPAEA